MFLSVINFPSRIGWVLLVCIAASLAYWSRLARRDPRLFWLYGAALVGAFVGAKLTYILAEGWLHLGEPGVWTELATGKSILGGLLGGYGAVEIAKRVVNYPGITGDWFARIVPLGILVGRTGCLINGCCLGLPCQPAWYSISDAHGVARWPAVPVEMVFNAAMFVIFVALRQGRVLLGQHFHLYLIAYGAFRFLHEFVRQEPRILGVLSGYHLAALAVLLFGWIGFVARRRAFRRMKELTRSLGAEAPQVTAPGVAGSE